MNKRLAVPLLLVAVLIPIIKKSYTVQSISFSKEQLVAIGNNIWRNESNNDPDKLLFWNAKEEFPSFGIGHFIWLPCSCSGRYEQTFPELIRFMEQKKIAIPQSLDIAYFPWNNRDDFMNKRSSPQLQELKKLLLETVDTQTEFMIYRLQKALEDKKFNNKKIKQQIDLLFKTPQGTFALIDYTNFKGTGLNPQEQYNNQGWGLLHVLERMNATQPKTALKQFVEQAQKLLETRVNNCPPDRSEEQFLAGWKHRINRYQF